MFYLIKTSNLKTMKLSHLAFFIFIFSTLFTDAIENKTINPTGTYKLKAKSYKKDGDTYGYTGKIQVKQIKTDSIIMSFYVSEGAPRYNSGSFIDTLYYSNNSAHYTGVDFEDSCKIKFIFNKMGLEIKDENNTSWFYCGFGYGVSAKGFYNKLDNKVPIIKDLLIEE